MMLFSQRKGLTPVKKVIQSDSMDDDLRHGLWNALDLFCWHRQGEVVNWISQGNLEILIKRLWLDFFKWPLDNLDDYWPVTYSKIRKIYYEFSWYEVYDFIEFIAANDEHMDSEVFMDFCNSILERELSAYRFVAGKITQITTEEEILEVEKALRVSEPYSNIRTHLKTALGLMANRKSPDYRNSIKESISAVEALCKSVTKNPKATLGQALKEIETKVGLHPALINAFQNLYGYTSDADGIRHALLNESNLTFEDAKFMLVSCSAFVNYLIAKASQAGIKI